MAEQIIDKAAENEMRYDAWAVLSGNSRLNLFNHDLVHSHE
jgi:hypothetical protein